MATLELCKEAEKKARILSTWLQTRWLCSQQCIPSAVKGLPTFLLPISSLSPCRSHRGPGMCSDNITREIIRHAEPQTLRTLTRPSGIHGPVGEVLGETPIEPRWKPYTCSVPLGLPWLLLSLAFGLPCTVPVFFLCSLILTLVLIQPSPLQAPLVP